MSTVKRFICCGKKIHEGHAKDCKQHDIIEFKGEYRFLSNFTAAVVRLDNMLYPTVEHAYQAAKTLSISERRWVQSLKTPAEAKKAGRSVLLRENWDQVKEEIMLDLLRKKFDIDSYRDKLLATGDAKLEEGNWWGDTYWGVFLSTGLGKNRLGVLLMQVRKEIREAGEGWHS